MIVVGFILIKLEWVILVIMVLWVFKDLNVINYVFLISLYIKKGGIIFCYKMRKKVIWRVLGYVIDNYMCMLG